MKTTQDIKNTTNFQHVAYQNLTKSQTKKRLNKFAYWSALENYGVTMRFNTPISVLKNKCVELNIIVK